MPARVCHILDRIPCLPLMATTPMPSALYLSVLGLLPPRHRTICTFANCCVMNLNMFLPNGKAQLPVRSKRCLITGTEAAVHTRHSYKYPHPRPCLSPLQPSSHLKSDLRWTPSRTKVVISPKDRYNVRLYNELFECNPAHQL